MIRLLALVLLLWTVPAVAAPIITVNTTSAAPGATVVATVTGAPVNPQTWIALYLASAADPGNYLVWAWFPTGQTTWSVKMPTTPGSYQVRLFINNDYTRVAASPVISVSVVPPPPPPPTALACGDALHSCVLTWDPLTGKVLTTSSVPIGPFTVTLPASPTFSGVVTAQGFASNGTGPGSLTLSDTTFAQLGAPTTHAMVFCSDCDPPATVNATCTSSGAKTGALAIRSNNVWKCK